MALRLRDTNERRIGWADALQLRPKLTARGLRALGRPVPASVRDDECVVLVEEES